MSSDAQSTAPVREGDVIADKYRVDRVLGEGGMGVVVAVTHLGLQQRFAMKFLLPSVALVPALVERFTREAQAAVKIHSEHVARVTDVGVLPTGAPYMLMEYLEGEDLAAVLKAQSSLPVADAVGFTLQALEAIAEAHSLGIIHRDLKPGNLFLARRPSGRSIIKVLDFGISKVESTTTRPALTGSGTLIGSPGYMSPEQMMAADTVDLTTDIWAIGIVLYEMLTGRRPFDAESLPELVATVLAKPHVPVKALRPDVPPALSDAIDCCLAKERTHRFQNVGQLASALAPFAPPHAAQSVERILGVLRAHPAPLPAFSAPPPVPDAKGSARSHGPGTFSPTSGGAVPMRSNAPLFAVAAVVVLVLLGGGAALAFRGRHAAITTDVVASASLPSASVAPPVSNPPIASPASGTASTPPPSAVDAGNAPSAPVTAHTGHAPKNPPAAASSVAPAASAPRCRRVSYYDSAGEEHFKMVDCP